jgi:hypothetical protein
LGEAAADHTLTNCIDHVEGAVQAFARQRNPDDKLDRVIAMWQKVRE